MREMYKKYDVYAYILFAYIFSIAMRYIWVYQFSGYESFYWNGQLMINTNDGYFWASGVKNLFNHELSNNMRVPGIEYGLVYFTYLVAKVLPFSLDTIILYMPAVISSLVVIPIILIGRLYNLTLVGFFAALLASITWSFYNRTMTGYYDTDLFALVFPVFIVYFLMKAVKKEDMIAFIIALFLNTLYFYAYDASKPIIYGIGLGFIFYSLIFLRKDKRVYDYIFLISISMLDIDWRVRIILLIVAILIVHKQIFKEEKVQIAITVLATLFFLYFNNVFGIIWGKIHTYIATGLEGKDGLHFFQVHQTIREAGKIPFETFANRISGSILSFIVAVVGYILLVFKKREFLLFVPLIGIGFFAYIGGLRFTVYAIPAMAFGVVYFFYFILGKMVSGIKSRYAILVLMTGLLLYPNIKHILSYKVPTVFNKEEVGSLEKLKAISSPKDYTLTWWDYGYPIWYYSNTNTLIDGGKHNADNYIVSKMFLTDSPQLLVNLARTAVEKYTEKKLNFTPVAYSIFEKNGTTLDVNDLIEEMTLDSFSLPKKTRDIYLYMPYRMLGIFPTVTKFGNLNLNTGKPERGVDFYPTTLAQQAKGNLIFRNGIVFDSKKGTLRIGRKEAQVKYYITTLYRNNGHIAIQSKLYHIDGNYVVIYMRSYNRYVIMDYKTFKSMYVQMFILGKYDKSLFELVESNPYVKIYKLKK